jgi:hypothetical protein
VGFDISEPRVLCAGVDWLHLTWQGPAKPPMELLEHFERLRVQAEARARAGIVEPLQVELAGVRLSVAPVRPRYPWGVLLASCDGASEPHFLVTVARVDRKDAAAPVVGVESRSLGLWTRGAAAWVERARELAAGALVLPETGEAWDLGEEHVARLDLCVDLQGHRWEGDPDEEERLVCRARRGRDRKLGREVRSAALRDKEALSDFGVRLWGRVGERFTGYEFGGRTAKLKARIYDKTREIRVSKKEWMREKWAESGRWVEDEPVWRVEGQFRRKPLKALGVGAWNPSRLDAVWRFFVGHDQQKWGGWLSYRERRNKNKTRWPLEPIWRAAQDATFFDPGASVAVRDRAEKSKMEMLVAQAAGCVASVAAIAGVSGASPSAIVDAALEAFGANVDETRWRDTLKERLAEMVKQADTLAAALDDEDPAAGFQAALARIGHQLDSVQLATRIKAARARRGEVPAK